MTASSTSAAVPGAAAAGDGVSAVEAAEEEEDSGLGLAPMERGRARRREARAARRSIAAISSGLLRRSARGNGGTVIIQYTDMSFFFPSSAFLAAVQHNVKTVLPPNIIYPNINISRYQNMFR
jgi:hypothetical protein